MAAPGTVATVTEEAARTGSFGIGAASGALRRGSLVPRLVCGRSGFREGTATGLVPFSSAAEGAVSLAIGGVTTAGTTVAAGAGGGSGGRAIAVRVAGSGATAVKGAATSTAGSGTFGARMIGSASWRGVA